MVRTLLVISLLALVAVPAAAQNYGDGFGVGGVFVPDGTGLIVVKTRLGNSLGVEASASLSTFSNDGSSSTDLALGIAAQKFWSTDDRLQPYFGGRFEIGHSSVDYDEGDLTRDDGGDSDTTFGIIGVLGAEYFISRRLSVEGEAGVGAHFGSFSLSTQTRLAAFLYL
ncbi:MAG: hypothetical protein GF405_09495 [Candidatus Eisenbacteria bacterium]|nr:hypothetical protein [Candidatus Eisenbacteria bacterium]